MALDKDVVSVLMTALMEEPSGTAREPTLKIFDCYCHITDQPLNYIKLSCKEFITSTVKGFIGALYTDELIGMTSITRTAHARDFIKVLSYIRKTSINNLEKLDWEPDLPKQCYPDWQLLCEKLDSDAVRYWGGWEVTSRKNQKAYFNLATVYNTHGKEFTLEFYNVIKKYYAKQAVINPTLFNAMMVYLSEHSEEWPVSIFQDPLKINVFFLAYMKHYFLKAQALNRDLPYKAKDWRQLVTTVEDAFIQPGVWAKPFESLPRPMLQEKTGALTKISKAEDGGTDIAENLLTSVPLSVTDEQAMEIIFGQISKDIKTVTNWAEEKATDLYRRGLKRKKLASSGKVIAGGMYHKSADQIDFPDICATFEHDGYVCDSSYLRPRFGGKNNKANKGLPYVAWQLGIPTTSSLFPYQLLLVAEHPKITSSFLKNFELYNKNGLMTGFRKTDSGYQLIGYKDRAKKSRAEQKIDLTAQSANLVKQVIEITEPLRNSLKAQGSDDWRFLFITSGTGFGKPQKANFPRWSIGYFNRYPKVHSQLIKEFEPHTELRNQALEKLLIRVSLGTLRKSRGVEIYIETESVEKMAEALGHAKYNANLLSHYLPEPLLAFFNSRWIRIFQKAFICEAMKDSPYLLEATSFFSMAELNEFLSNHALKIVADQQHDADIDQGKGEVYVNIDTGILTALMSVERAVNASTAPDKICGTARYWAKVSRLITLQIESEQDPDLCKHLEQANRHADENAMECLIYAA